MAKTYYESQLTRKSFSISFRLSLILFVIVSVFLFWMTVTHQIRSVRDKVETDKELLNQSIKIGDIYFIKKYLASFVRIEKILAAGIVDQNGNWLEYKSEDRKFESIVRFYWTYISIPITNEISSDPQIFFRYNLGIPYNVLFLPLVISVFIGLIVFVVLGEYKTMIDTIDGQRDELRQQEIMKEKLKISRQVAHDVRSPIGALKTAAEYLDKNPSAARQLISKAIGRIDKIVGELSANSQAMVGRVNLKELIDDLVAEKKAEYSEGDCEVKFEVDIEDGIYFVFGEGSGLARAISNIINNSIEAAIDRRVTVGISLRSENDKIILNISDNGEGIDDNQIGLIFDHGFTAGKRMGSGLGLAQAKDAVFNANGTINVYSKLGVGTKIEISFRI